MDERKAWDRQKGETSACYRKFVIYRDLNPDTRSITAAYNEHRSRIGLPPRRQHTGLWGGIAAKDQWVSRAEAWDDEQERRRRATRQKAIDEMNERHAQVGRTLVNRVVGHLLKNKDTEFTTQHSMLETLEAGSKLERLALGEPTEVVARSGPAIIGVGVLDRTFSERVLANPNASRAADTILAVLAGMEES